MRHDLCFPIPLGVSGLLSFVHAKSRCWPFCSSEIPQWPKGLIDGLMAVLADYETMLIVDDSQWMNDSTLFSGTGAIGRKQWWPSLTSLATYQGLPSRYPLPQFKRATCGCRDGGRYLQTLSTSETH
ncbi:hypothetical protein C8J56DRAFT_419707 [Mycena floridula]|nr:hypothetical protein C8J56DRAFT_419707 [Mycena floridula]